VKTPALPLEAGETRVTVVRYSQQPTSATTFLVSLWCCLQVSASSRSPRKKNERAAPAAAGSLHRFPRKQQGLKGLGVLHENGTEAVEPECAQALGHRMPRFADLQREDAAAEL
jgi:hypothetical protein